MLITFNASLVSRVHTVIAYAAFASALAFGLLHFKKIVKNDVAGWPDEWWPSVSATIGDWYPERSIFQILIALTSGPRFILVFTQYLLAAKKFPNSVVPLWTFVAGLIRTLSCGGWVYITSSDDHDTHDVLMIAYIVLNIPWMFGCTLSSLSKEARRRRVYTSTLFFAALVPMIWLFLRHKVHRIPGAYTYYAFFEWFLILADVYFDSITKLDFETEHIQISIGARSENGVIKKADQERVVVAGDRGLKEMMNVAEPKKITPLSKAEQQSNSWLSLISDYRPAISFVSDVYLSYLWWTIFTVLAPSLFYFSVWELAMTGTEATLLILLSPYLLSMTPVLQALSTHNSKTTLHSITLLALAAYLDPSPGRRLAWVTIGNASAILVQAIDWVGGVDPITVILGIMAGIVSKGLSSGNNPLWTIVNSRSGGGNLVGLLLGIGAVWEFASRPPTPALTKGRNVKAPSSTLLLSWLLPSLSLGALLFAFHQLLADSSTLITWSWTGYPISGPVKGVHDSFVIVFMFAGLILSFVIGHYTIVSKSLIALGATALYTLYNYKDWLGFAGGCGYAVWLCYSASAIFALQANVHPAEVGKRIGTAWLCYILLCFADVWTVAYAFVPGGEFLRERTDLVLIVQFFFVSLPLLVKSQENEPQTIKMSSASFARIYSVLALLLSISVFSTSGLNSAALGPPLPHRSPERLITAGIWTVHFGIDLEGRDSQRRMRNLVKDMELDVLGLLETDLNRIVFGHRDLTKVIANDLGYYVDPGPGPNKHTWGAVLMSKFPIINSTHHLLPSPNGELAPAISAVLDVWGTEILVVVAHNGQEEDPLDRELQSKELARILSEWYPRPAIFLGYVVTRPHAERPAPYRILVEDGRMHDIDKDDMERWCEYILYRGLYRTGYGRVSRSTITDTELQIGKFVLPRHGTMISEEMQTEDLRYLRSFKEDLAQRWWFNDSYYGGEGSGGIRGHYWHVFGTPLYYKVPSGAEL